MDEEMGLKHELAVDKVYQIARELARVKYNRLENRGLVTHETLDALRLYLNVALATSDKTNEDKHRKDMRERYILAANETRNSINLPLSRAHAIRAGQFIAALSFRQAVLIISKQDARQRQEPTISD